MPALELDHGGLIGDREYVPVNLVEIGAKPQDVTVLTNPGGVHGNLQLPHLVRVACLHGELDELVGGPCAGALDERAAARLELLEYPVDPLVVEGGARRLTYRLKRARQIRDERAGGTQGRSQGGNDDLCTPQAPGDGDDVQPSCSPAAHQHR